MAPQPRIFAPRIDTLKTIFRELAGKKLVTNKTTKGNVRNAVVLMKGHIAQGSNRWANHVPKFETWLAKQDHVDRFQSFAYDHIPAPLPAHLANVVPLGSMLCVGAPAASNHVAQFTSLFKTPSPVGANYRTNVFEASFVTPPTSKVRNFAAARDADMLFIRGRVHPTGTP